MPAKKRRGRKNVQKEYTLIFSDDTKKLDPYG